MAVVLDLNGNVYSGCRMENGLWTGGLPAGRPVKRLLHHCTSKLMRAGIEQVVGLQKHKWKVFWE